MIEFGEIHQIFMSKNFICAWIYVNECTLSGFFIEENNDSIDGRRVYLLTLFIGTPNSIRFMRSKDQQS